MRNWALILLVALSVANACAQSTEDKDHERWAVYYGSALKSETFLLFDLVVFDADHHPALTPLAAHGRTILGYLSLGEAESYRPYYKELKQKGLLLGANEHWKGHQIIDVRKPAWESIVNDKLIPEILAQGFNGIMLDTIDSPLHLENENPKNYPGMHDASVRLIQSIRTRYPDIKIMLNRGFEIVPRVSSDIDMLLAESTRADILPGEKHPKMVPEKDYIAYVQKIQDARANAPDLKVYTLDYWNMKDGRGIERIYADQRAHGFIPYVATLDLQQVFTEAY